MTVFQDSENYIVLLHALAPEQCSLQALKTKDLYERASQLLESADKIGCRRYVTPADIVQVHKCFILSTYFGKGNAQLNLAFVAYLFTVFNKVQLATPKVELPEPDFEEFVPGNLLKF